MNAHTKQQQDKVFETDFIDSQKSDPLFAHLLALSHIFINSHSHLSLVPVSIRVGLFQPLHSAGMECAHYSPTALSVKGVGFAQRGRSSLEKHKMMRSF